MRPGIGFETSESRSRNSSTGESARPSTFFITRDPDPSSPPTTSAESIPEGASPLQKLKETLEEASRTSKHNPHKYKQHDVSGGSARRRSTIKPQVVEEMRYNMMPQLQPEPSSLVSLTPSLPSREMSIPSSPKSTSSQFLQRSDEESVLDETGSQAITSSDDEHDERMPSEIQDSAPQLIMPSIKMPSRRPFTQRGKHLGKFKILVTGNKGCGRTSLIKSIVQLCEDIVHVDPLNTSTLPQRRSTTQEPSSFNEIYASTKPYPAWWSDIDESRILRRRKSMGDSVLERNICFVDTMDSGKTDKVIAYLEQQFLSALNSVSMPNKDLVDLLSGRGGSQVDVVLYLISKDTLKFDCARIRRMSQLCNVVPLISKSDTLTPGQISDLKAASELVNTALPHLPYIGVVVESAIHATAPYTVSSANGPDIDNMDASLLMSAEYVQPLIPSELAILVDQLFDPDIVSFLRFSTAKKLLNWYSSEPKFTQIPSPSLRSAQPSIPDSPFHVSLSNSGVLVPITSEISLNTSNSYALAKIADHAQREEHLAQIRLSKWASDLQLSLQRERERYESISRSERALWLVQRMGEEIREGQVIPIGASHAIVRTGGKSIYPHSMARYEVHDPLGLLRWQDSARTRGWIALQIIGSFGVVGGVALWLAKTWGLTATLCDWTQGWSAN